MILSRTDRLVLGLLLGLALLTAGVGRLTGPAQRLEPKESAEPVELNTASFAELLRLPGIGPVLAERIIAYREQNGPFRSLEELLHVRGIGPKLLRQLEGRVRIDEGLLRP